MSTPPAPGIRSHLALLALSVGLPAALVAVGLLVLEHHRERQRLERDSIATARAMTQAVDRELAAITAVARLLATSRPAREGDLAAVHEHGRQLADARLGINVVLSAADARQLMNTLRPLGEALPLHGNPRQVEAVFATAAPVLSDLYRGGVLGRPVISVDVPVLRDGQVIYSLSVGELPERFREVLRRQKLPEGWIGAVLDRNGIIVARSHEHDRFVGSSGAQALVAGIAEQSEGALEAVTVEGIPVVSVFSRSPDTGWSVALGIPRAQIAEQLWRRTRLAAGASVMLLGLGLALAWMTGGIIARSIRALESAAAGIGRREEIRVAPLGVREADELGAALGRASRMIAAAEHRAYHDPLTGLGNRALLHEMATQQIALCRRRGGHLSVLFIDLDGFKKVNDTLGHDVGDALLCEAATRLTRAIRSSDVAARVGGDEFAVLLEGADRQDAALLAGKVAAALAAPYEAIGSALPMSGSVGAATYPRDGRTAEELLRCADEAMYRAKSAKRA